MSDDIWTTHSAQSEAASENTLYDVPKYDDALYSSMPTTEWQKGTEGSATWIVPVTREVVLPLYSQKLYSQVGYGQTPGTIWTSTAAQ